MDEKDGWMDVSDGCVGKIQQKCSTFLLTVRYYYLYIIYFFTHTTEQRNNNNNSTFVHNSHTLFYVISGKLFFNNTLNE